MSIEIEVDTRRGKPTADDVALRDHRGGALLWRGPGKNWGIMTYRKVFGSKDEPAPATGGAGAPGTEITLEMISAGILAADLISFEWGLDDEGALVSRVFQAMRDASPRPPLNSSL